MGARFRLLCSVYKPDTAYAQPVGVACVILSVSLNVGPYPLLLTGVTVAVLATPPTEYVVAVPDIPPVEVENARPAGTGVAGLMMYDVAAGVHTDGVNDTAVAVAKTCEGAGKLHPPGLLAW